MWIYHPAKIILGRLYKLAAITLSTPPNNRVEHQEAAIHKAGKSSPRISLFNQTTWDNSGTHLIQNSSFAGLKINQKEGIMGRNISMEP